MESIKITNSLTGKKELFKPINDKEVRMYACGITVYDHSHIGHAMQAIVYDVIRNYFKYAGYEVTYVRNYTDVDDKIINRAAESNLSPKQLAEDMIKSCDEDLLALGIENADYQPKVSECIPEIIAMIEDIIKNDGAYVTEAGDVYYRVRQKADYGKLSNRKPDDMRSGTRELSGSQKQDELDFALWKSDTTPDASWESPWGKGRPGWHIECSAMAKKYLGDQLDIHGGGRDLIFPHHENEIAQSETANQCQYANVWIHSGLMTIDKQKMSKSLGNHISIKDFLKEWPPEVLRLGVLSHHYGSNIDFSLSVFQKCLSRLIYYYETLEQLSSVAGDASSKGLDKFDVSYLTTEFKEAMNDDFNTTIALAKLNVAFKRANELLRQKDSPEKQASAAQWLQSFKEIGGVLGLFGEDPQAFAANLKRHYLTKIEFPEGELNKLIDERKTARAAKNWGKSDEIRDTLKAKGIVLKDLPEKTIWTIDPESID